MRKPIFAFAVPLVFLLVAAVTAQNPPRPSSSKPPPSNPPAGQPPQDHSPRSGSTSHSDRRNPSDESGAEQGTPLPFASLDRAGAGYLTRAAAARDRWLSRHFDRCDVDRDARLTRDEYETCARTPVR